MSEKYVKFGPGIEYIEPDFDQKVLKITADIKEFISKSKERNGGKYATRDAHAKGYGVAKAEFQIFENLPAEFAQGLYSKPGRYEAVLRFSNGSARVISDAKSGNAMGIAIKIFGVEGQTMLDDEPDSRNFDYNMINWPIFFCNSAEHYLYIDRIFLKVNEYLSKGIPGKLSLAYDWLTGFGKFFPGKESWKELKAFLSFQKIEPNNTLLHTFYTMGAVRHGDYIAKLRVKPVKEYADMVTRRKIDPTSAEQVFGPALIAELKEHAYEFDIQIQLCKDLKKMPVEDLTKEWSQELSPFVTVGKLRIPKQDIAGALNNELMEQLSFTPFRCLEENRPMGNLQLTRKEAYRTSSMLRHKLNNMERKEPENLKALFETKV